MAIEELHKYEVINCCEIQSHNCPLEVLKTVLDRGKNDYNSQCAAMNPNCPPELLKMVLDRGIFDTVSRYAFQNHNCPPEAKVKWLKKLGIVKRFNPKKHKI